MIGWLLFVFTFEVPAWLVMLYFIVFQFIEGVSSVGDVFAQRGGTAFFAHIGGFVRHGLTSYSGQETVTTTAAISSGNNAGTNHVLSAIA